MNAWTITLVVLLVALLAGGWRCGRGSTDDRLVGLMFASEVGTMIFLALGAASHRSFYLDCALAAVLLPYASSIVFARFFEKWL